MRTGSHDTQAALQDIEELWQVIQRKALQPTPEPRDLAVHFPFALDALRLQAAQGAELREDDLFAIQTDPPLTVEDRPRAADSNTQRQQHQHGGCEQQHHRGDADVAAALDQFIGAGKGRLADADHRKPAHVLQPPLHDVRPHHVGHEEQRCRGALQPVDERPHAGLRRHGQSDVDLAYPEFVHIAGHFVYATQPLHPRLGLQAAILPVVEIAHHGPSRRVALSHRLRRPQPQGAAANHHGLAARVVSSLLAPHESAQQHQSHPVQHGRHQHPFPNQGPVQFIQTSGDVGAQAQNAQQQGPIQRNVQRHLQRFATQAGSPGESQRNDEQRQGRRPRTEWPPTPDMQRIPAGDDDQGLQYRRQQRGDGLRRGKERTQTGRVVGGEAVKRRHVDDCRCETLDLFGP